jgi:hypothetical protein
VTGPQDEYDACERFINHMRIDSHCEIDTDYILVTVVRYIKMSAMLSDARVQFTYWDRNVWRDKQGLWR